MESFNVSFHFYVNTCPKHPGISYARALSDVISFPSSDSTPGDEADEGYEDDHRSVKSIEAAKDRKKKKKIKKVMSWNV